MGVRLGARHPLLSVCLSVCLSVRLSVCLSVCLSVRPSVCLSVYPSIYHLHDEPAARSMADTKASTVAGTSWLCGKYADTRHFCSELVSRGVSGEAPPTSPQPQPMELQ